MRKPCVIFCAAMLFLQTAWIPTAEAAQLAPGSARANQTAQILGVSAELEALQGGAADLATRDRLRAKIMNRILLGYLEVRETSDRIDVDLDNAYGAIAGLASRQQLGARLANTANFIQFGVLFTLGACLRLDKQFLAAKYLTNTTAGINLALSSLALYALHSGRDKRPVAAETLLALHTSGLPTSVDRYLNSRPVGESRTRKELAIAEWRKRFDVDDYAALASAKAHRLGQLNDRLVILYSLNAQVEQFDDDLLALLQTIQANEVRSVSDLDSVRDADFNIDAFEKVLAGALEVRNFVDRVDREKHYQFDVVLSDMTRRRDRALTLNNIANFTQTGVIKSIAGAQFFKRNAPAGNRLLTVMSGLNILLATVGIYESRGGKRKIDTDTNVLASFFNLDVAPDRRVSPLIESYLQQRRAELLTRWKQHHIISDTPGERTLSRLADTPENFGKKVDTIPFVRKRLRMMFDVRALVERLDDHLFQVVISTGEPQDASLLTAKKALVGALEVRRTTDKIDDELASAYTAQGELISSRDRGIALNNATNFLQSGIAGTVTGGLSLKGKSVPADRINIVTGGTTLLMSSVALWQSRGPRTKTPVPSTVISEFVDGAQRDSTAFGPFVWSSLNTGTGGGPSPREVLLARWKAKRLVPLKKTNSDDIRSITNKITMLSDVHTLVESLDKKLADSLRIAVEPI